MHIGHLGNSCVAGCLLILSLALTCLTPDQALAAGVPQWAKGTWSPISTTVTVVDGWVVARGMTTFGTSNDIMWQVPLAPVGGRSVAVQHGPATTLVQAAGRRFVIDNATGRTHELRNGRIWRRWPPGGEATTPPVYTLPQSPPRYATVPTAPPELTIPQPATQPTVAPLSRDPELRAVQTHQLALASVMTAEDKLLATLEVLKDVRIMRARRQATDADVRAARAAVDLARLEVRGAQMRASQLAAVTTRPSRPEADVAQISPRDRRQIRDAQERMLAYSARYNQAAGQAKELREAKADAATIAKAEQAMLDYDQLATTAQLDLQRVRLAAASPDVPVRPELRSRITRLERAVIDQTRRVESAEAQLARVRDAQVEGAASQADVQNTLDRLMAQVAELTSARRELASLHSEAYRTQGTALAGPPATTAPAQGEE